MRNDSSETAPVGVVPRRQAQSIEPLMSDTTPETCTVAGDIEPLQDRSGPMWPQWLSTVAAFGGVAAALEWLKLTR